MTIGKLEVNDVIICYEKIRNKGKMNDGIVITKWVGDGLIDEYI